MVGTESIVRYHSVLRLALRRGADRSYGGGGIRTKEFERHHSHGKISLGHWPSFKLDMSKFPLDAVFEKKATEQPVRSIRAKPQPAGIRSLSLCPSYPSPHGTCRRICTFLCQ